MPIAQPPLISLHVINSTIITSLLITSLHFTYHYFSPLHYDVVDKKKIYKIKWNMVQRNKYPEILCADYRIRIIQSPCEYYCLRPTYRRAYVITANQSSSTNVSYVEG
jgi:hypothetical protein